MPTLLQHCTNSVEHKHIILMYGRQNKKETFFVPYNIAAGSHDNLQN